jgi:hypothetical protein
VGSEEVCFVCVSLTEACVQEWLHNSLLAIACPDRGHDLCGLHPNLLAYVDNDNATLIIVIACVSAGMALNVVGRIAST